MTEPAECPPMLSVRDACIHSRHADILLWSSGAGMWVSCGVWEDWSFDLGPFPACYAPPPPPQRVDPSVPANLIGRTLIGRTEPVTGVQYVEDRRIQWTESPTTREVSWLLPLPVGPDGLVAVKPR